MRLALPFAAIAAAVLLAARATTPSDRAASTATPSVGAAASAAVDDTPEIRLVEAALVTSVTACLDAGAAKNPGMEGRVGIEATIAPGGGVTSSVVTRNDGLPDGVAQCVATVYRNAPFPARGHVYKRIAGLVDVNQRAKP